MILYAKLGWLEIALIGIVVWWAVRSFIRYKAVEMAYQDERKRNQGQQQRSFNRKNPMDKITEEAEYVDYEELN